jgi:hypothetical protein
MPLEARAPRRSTPVARAAPPIARGPFRSRQPTVAQGALIQISVRALVTGTLCERSRQSGARSRSVALLCGPHGVPGRRAACHFRPTVPHCVGDDDRASSADLLHDSDVKVTRLAHGVPVGGELDYLGEGHARGRDPPRTPFESNRAECFIPPLKRERGSACSAERVGQPFAQSPERPKLIWGTLVPEMVGGSPPTQYAREGESRLEASP